ncbi:MAG: hypothetical protein ACJ790_15630, partial [Myxococcaceae bacterium]
MRAPKTDATVIRPAVPKAGADDSFAAQLAAFTVAMNKQPAPLLDSLAEELAPAAKAVADRLAKGTSADRQGALARHFGLRVDAHNRLRDVVTEAGPHLRAEICRLAPHWMRSWISDLVGAAPAPAAPPFV